MIVKLIKITTIDTSNNSIISVEHKVETNQRTEVTVKPTVAPVETDQLDNLLEVKDNKLILSDSLINGLGAIPGDRITINYLTKDDKVIPIIGVSKNLGDENAGNKLTKSKTVSFKGQQFKSLSVFGTSFKTEPLPEYDNLVHKLIISDVDNLIVSDDELCNVPVVEDALDEFVDSWDKSNEVNFDFNFDSI